MFGVGEAGFQARRIGAGEFGQIARRAGLVPEDMRTGIKVFHRQVAGQKLAIAVGEIGAGGEELIIDRRTGMMLGWQAVITDSGAANLPAGTVAYQLAITARAITDNLDPPRAHR